MASALQRGVERARWKGGRFNTKDSGVGVSAPAGMGRRQLWKPAQVCGAVRLWGFALKTGLVPLQPVLGPQPASCSSHCTHDQAASGAKTFSF